MEKMKRVALTVESEPYEQLRALSKELDLPTIWLSEEFNKMVKALIPVFSIIIKQREDQLMQNKTMTEGELIRSVVSSIEKTQGVRLKDFLKE